MDSLQQKLNEILSSPEKLDEVMKIAGEFLGSGTNEEPSPAPVPSPVPKNGENKPQPKPKDRGNKGGAGRRKEEKPLTLDGKGRRRTVRTQNPKPSSTQRQDGQQNLDKIPRQEKHDSTKPVPDTEKKAEAARQSEAVASDNRPPNHADPDPKPPMTMDEDEANSFFISTKNKILKHNKEDNI